MAAENIVTGAEGRDLYLTCLINAPREKVYRAWTEPELVKQWFCPRPWTTPVFEADFRSGGGNRIVMRGPEGQEFEERGMRSWYTAAAPKPCTPSMKRRRRACCSASTFSSSDYASESM